MALSKPTSPDDRTRFFRLGLVIIEELTPVLQDVLTNEIPPSNIFNTVKQNKRFFQKLGADQIDKINNAKTQGYKDFDITLLYALLRNLCPNIPEPTKGWGISLMPEQSETTLGDDIERIRLIRNNVYGHISVLSVSETEFKEYWSTISDICNRMQVLLGKNYAQSLQTAKECTIDSAAENMYMNKIKDLIESEKSTRELLQTIIKEKELSSKETVRIETKNPQKKKFGDKLIKTSVFILNVMVKSIHEKSSESEIERLYEAIEHFMKEEKEESSRLASDPFFEELTQKIIAIANVQEEKRMEILGKFFQFIMYLEKNYNAHLVSSEGSLLLMISFSSERGYDLYKEDMEKGKIRQQILDVLLFPPYLASFNLKAEDLDVFLNGQKLTKEQEHKYFIKTSQTHAHERIRCDVCKNKSSEFQCQKCEIKLCKTCEREHWHPIEISKPIPFYPQCTLHDEKCSMYCYECEIPVCNNCIESDQHLDHKLLEIWKILDERREKIVKEQTELRDTIYPTYLDIASDVEYTIKQLEKKYEDHSFAISNHGDKWHKEIDILVEKFKDELDEMKSKQILTLERHLGEIKEKMTKITAEINSAAALLDSDDISKQFNFTSNLDKYRKPPQQIELSFPKFIRGTIPEVKKLCSLFGTISPGEISSSEHDSICMTTKQLLEEPEIITTINTAHGLNNVACLSIEKIWTSGDDITMKQFSISQGTLLKSITTKSGNIPYDLAVSNRGHLVYTDPEERSVNIVKNEKIETVVDLRLQHWRPRNICSTFSGDLLVVMDSDYGEASKIVRYSGSKEKQTLCSDDQGQPLYSSSYIKYISENRNLNICVADSAANAVVVVNQAGKLRFRYTGHTPAPKNKQFFPRGITTDTQSQILTADYDNECIHIIDQDGQFLAFIDCELSRPWGLCTDTNDNLFVTQFLENQVKKIKYMQ